MNYEDTMVIVADLGELKAFHVKKNEGMVENELKISYSLEMLNDISYIDAHKRVQDVVSDSAGRLGTSGTPNAGKWGSSTGEPHNLENERKRRSIKDVANDINMIVKNEKPKQLLLAFPQETNAQLIDALTQETKAVLVKNVASDLINTRTSEILSHF
ncbi:MAG TPA: host attachment protein [Sulfurovum sp.]|uniref:host attachment protein n=1 Tax=Sulfurovum sp. TaxID=1969726 RepID=UPI002F93E5E1